MNLALVFGIVVALAVIAFFVYKAVSAKLPEQPKPVDDAEAVVRVADIQPVIKPADVVGDKGAETYYRLFGGGAPANWREIRDGQEANQPARDWSYKDSRVIRWDGNWLLAQSKDNPVVYSFDTGGRPARISIAKQSGGNSYQYSINNGPFRGLTDSGDTEPFSGVGTFTIQFLEEGTASIAGRLLGAAPQVAPDATRR